MEKISEIKENHFMNIQFPKYDFRLKKEKEQEFIFDNIRKKFVALTPEEWVRQHWIHFLIREKKYPRSMIAVEMSLKVNRLSKRCDLVVFGKSGQPVMIVECKAPEVKLTQKVFNQIARYNLTLKVKYLLVSNGAATLCSKINFKKKSFELLEEIPSVKMLNE